MFLMTVLKKWNSLSLIIRILICLVIGAILGLLLPQLTWLAILGDLFVGALKAIAPLLVFILVASSLANAKGGHGQYQCVPCSRSSSAYFSTFALRYLKAS